MLPPVSLVAVCARHGKQPNIVMILADDLGWNDVPWHNPSVLAPHLNHLATSGVILEQHYVQPKCAPSRAALLTGRYPYRSVRLLYSPGSCAVKYHIYL